MLALGIRLLSISVYAEGIGFNIGPFSMQFNFGDTYYEQDHKDILDFHLCFAISNQKQVVMVVEAQEKLNSKETRFTTKRLLVESYALGVTKEGQPVLRGNVVKEKLIKYGDEKSNEDGKWAKKRRKLLLRLV